LFVTHQGHAQARTEEENGFMAQEKPESPLAKVQEGKDANERTLLTLSNVVGVGIGYKEVHAKETKELCINIYVEKKIAKNKLPAEQLVPETLLVPETSEEIKTDVREVGRIEALTFANRIRPVRPGYSIGHFNITAGTIGCLVRDACYPYHIYILSNNHVLADCNAAVIGDPIMQPGRFDGGMLPGDMVARLSHFISIRFGSPDHYNLVDAALAQPTDHRNMIASVVGLGMPRGTVEAILGMDVVKSGRTTQTTAGKVIGIDATVAVGYGSAGTAYFRNQIMTTNMSKGGDSGSLLMSRTDREATGLLFAGSSKVTVHNNIANVLMALGVEIVTA